MCLRITILAVLALALSGGALRAAGPVSATPGSVSVNAGGSSTITIRWRVGVESRLPGMVTVTSPRGELEVGGVPVPGGGALSRTIRHGGGGTQFVTFTERVTVDRTTAQRLGAGATGRYLRVFSDVQGPATGVVALRAGSGGGLALRNFDLQFDDQTRFRVVETALVDRRIETAPTNQVIIVCATGQNVVAAVAKEDIVAPTPKQRVIPAEAEQFVSVLRPGQEVGFGIAKLKAVPPSGHADFPKNESMDARWCGRTTYHSCVRSHDRRLERGSRQFLVVAKGEVRHPVRTIGLQRMDITP